YVDSVVADRAVRAVRAAGRLRRTNARDGDPADGAGIRRGADGLRTGRARVARRHGDRRAVLEPAGRPLRPPAAADRESRAVRCTDAARDVLEPALRDEVVAASSGL